MEELGGGGQVWGLLGLSPSSSWLVDPLHNGFPGMQCLFMQPGLGLPRRGRIMESFSSWSYESMICQYHQHSAVTTSDRRYWIYTEYVL